MIPVIDHFMRLGLSEYEARAYVATVTLGEGTVKEISAESGVPRSRAYDVMDRLAERGFVQVSNSSPLCYRANEPLVASQNLMEEIKHANDEIVRELNEIGRKAEKAENPIWTLTGERSIDHKITELLTSARNEIVFICFNNRLLIRYGQMLSERSQAVPVCVAPVHRAESFIGRLGRSRVLKLMPRTPPEELDGELTEKGYITRDSRYCVELLMLIDDESTLILTREEETHRAIVITGTVMSLLCKGAVETIMKLSEEVTASPLTGQDRWAGEAQGTRP